MNLMLKLIPKICLSLFLIMSAAAIFPFPAFSEVALIDDADYQEVVRLRELKTSDPARYQLEIRAKKEAIRSKINQWKSDEPQKYQSFMTQDHALRQQRMEQFQKNHPEEFRGFAQKRMRRFEQLREKNPERFNQVMSAHPQLKDRVEKMGAERKSNLPKAERSPSKAFSEQQNRNNRAPHQKNQEKRPGDKPVLSQRPHRKPGEIENRRNEIRENDQEKFRRKQPSLSPLPDKARPRGNPERKGREPVQNHPLEEMKHREPAQPGAGENSLERNQRRPYRASPRKREK